MGPSDRGVGLYIWDFHDRKPVPLELMEHQCELGLKWLKQKRIHEMIFLADARPTAKTRLHRPKCFRCVKTSLSAPPGRDDFVSLREIDLPGPKHARS